MEIQNKHGKDMSYKLKIKGNERSSKHASNTSLRR